MQYLYCFANVSLTLRLINFLSNHPALKPDVMTIIYLVDRWVVRIQFDYPLTPFLAGNFSAFLNENGIPYTPLSVVSEALTRLDQGLSLREIMNRYQVVIVSHGVPRPHDLQKFRHHFVEGLGYCPQNLV